MRKGFVGERTVMVAKSRVDARQRSLIRGEHLRIAEWFYDRELSG
jgi:hypothetical protein